MSPEYEKQIAEDRAWYLPFRREVVAFVAAPILIPLMLIGLCLWLLR
jgi:hypothetical protein